jgi:hypothetical protein
VKFRLVGVKRKRAQRIYTAWVLDVELLLDVLLAVDVDDDVLLELDVDDDDDVELLLDVLLAVDVDQTSMSTSTSNIFTVFAPPIRQRQWPCGAVSHCYCVSSLVGHV